ncbi:MAG: cytidine deaminase [Synergistaceae bacterium]|jgi:cytidine deaminase|nr:cytidine deaminase [Synergistaceae bacterium]
MSETRTSDAENFQWPRSGVGAEELLEKARTAAENAYAPYSGFRVGAALMTSDGSVFSGCNVENASYGMSICAERNAVGAMIVAGHLDPVVIAVTGGENGEPCPPCGACRQVLLEFNPDLRVVLESPEKILILRVDLLLPLTFSLMKKN